MATAVLSIDIEARIAKLESGLRDASGAVKDFGKSTKASADDAAKATKSIKAGADESSSAMDRLKLSTVGVHREFLVLVHEATQGNWKQFGGSLLVLGERMDALGLVFSKGGLAIGGAAAALAIFAYAVAKAEGIDRATKAIETGFSATGHAALLTEAQVKQYITTLERLPGSSRESAEKSLTELSRVPNMTGPLFTRAVADLQGFSLLIGKDLPEAAKEMANALQHPATAAKKLDDELNILTVAQRLSIAKFEEQGKSAEALKVLLEAVESGSKHLADNALTPLQQSSHNLRLEWDSLNDSFGKTGAIEATQTFFTTLLRGLKNYIEYAESHKALFALSPIVGMVTSAAITGLDKPQGLVSGKVTRPGEEALATDKIEHDRRTKEANDFFLKFNQEFDRGYKRKHEIEIFNAQADALIGTATEKSAADRAKAIANINQKYKDRGGVGAKDDPTKALLANQVREYEKLADQEHDIFLTRNKKLEVDFSEHLISIQAYYEGLRTSAATALKARLGDYDKAIAALEADKNKPGTKETARAEDQGKINDMIAKKTKLQEESARFAVEENGKEIKSYEGLAKEIAGVHAELAKLTGEKGESAGIAFDAKYKELRAQLAAEGNIKELGAVSRLKDETVAQGELNDKVAEAALIYEKLRNTEENIAIARQFGTISEMESLGALGAAREASIVQLESILKETEAIAATSSGTKLPLEAQKARLEFDKLRASGDVLGDHMRTLFKDDLSGPMTTFFDDLAAGKNVLDSLKGAFTSFATSVVHDINSIVAKNFAESLFAKGSPGGDAASWLAKLFGGAGAGGAKGGTSFAGGADSAAAEDVIGKIAAKDTGSSGVVDSLLGGLTGANKGDAPGNPLYVSDVSLYGMTGGSGGGVAGGGGSGDGGLIGTGIKAIGNYFGSSGGASAGTSFAGGADATAAETFFSMFAEAGAGAASGGDTTPGWFMAGEQGRELIRTKGARVYNNRDTEKMLGAQVQQSGDTIHNYNITVTPPDGSDRRTALQWGEAVGQRIRSSGRNS